MPKPLPQEIQLARSILGRKHSYVASILWSLSFKEAPGLGTLGVDKHWRCIYDPEVIKQWSKEEMVGVLFHEINHILRDHPERSEAIAGVEDIHNVDETTQRALQKMNIAEDAEINPELIKCGFRLPGQYVMPSLFNLPDGLLAEEYYHKMPDNPKSDKGKGKNKDKIVGQGRCGSCSGNALEGEEEAPAPGDRLSKAEQDLIKRAVAKDIEQCVKQRGDVPAGLARWADTLLHPQVKWSKELASVVRRSMIEVMGKQDYTYKRPSRKAGCLDRRIITPGMKAFIPNVAIVIDTSGSMGESDLGKAVAECKGILQTLGGNGFGITEIAVDCVVAVKKRVNSARKIDLAGGGGTDMRIGLSEAESLRPMPDVVVVVTDGYTPWPTENTPFKTIVVLTQGGAKAQVPDFFKCIEVN